CDALGQRGPGGDDRAGLALIGDPGTAEVAASAAGDAPVGEGGVDETIDRVWGEAAVDRMEAAAAAMGGQAQRRVLEAGQLTLEPALGAEEAAQVLAVGQVGDRHRPLAELTLRRVGGVAAEVGRARER